MIILYESSRLHWRVGPCWRSPLGLASCCCWRANASATALPPGHHDHRLWQRFSILPTRPRTSRCRSFPAIRDARKDHRVRIETFATWLKRAEQSLIMVWVPEAAHRVALGTETVIMLAW